jgi:predicted unusual protein kinase regulating ubiquinone biosynthesis (AarF/ABC1/UbiB family)
MSNTLQEYGGVLSKVSQILSLNDQNNSSFDDCKPFSKEKTTLFFKQFIESQDISCDNFEVYRSGSVGQVYKAIHDNKDVICKVQYAGLYEQTRSDLEMLDKVATFLYCFADVKTAMLDVKQKMYEELDYIKEAENHKLMYDLYKNTDIKIPKLIPSLCTDKVLVMHYMKGQSLQDFIANSDQTQRNILGNHLVKFVFENIYKHGILYSDVHYGNFLVRKDCKLGVLDFGCLHYLDKQLLSNLRKLHKSIRDNNQPDFYDIVTDMGIIKPDITEESKTYIYDYFRMQYTPWISPEFEFTDEWLELSTNKDGKLMKEWVLQPDMVYFNKIPYGSYHIFTKLKLKGNFRQMFDDMFVDID